MKQDRDREGWSGEQDQFSVVGDWGAPGTWGAYGNRPDFSRDLEWRFHSGLDWGHVSDRGRNDDWGRHPEWGRVKERYSGGTQTYSKPDDV